MILSQQLQDQIRQEAEAYSIKSHDIERWAEKNINPTAYTHYKRGATTYALLYQQQSECLAKAEEMMVNYEQAKELLQEVVQLGWNLITYRKIKSFLDGK